MVQFSKKNKNAVKELTELVTFYFFLKDQTSYYINICISFSKNVFVIYPYICVCVCVLCLLNAISITHTIIYR